MSNVRPRVTLTGRGSDPGSAEVAVLLGAEADGLVSVQWHGVWAFFHERDRLRALA